MTTTLAICIVLTTFILCMFTFFTIVYLSELKRERELRKAMLKEQKQVQELMQNMPVIVMDLPTKSKSDTIPMQTIKEKKNVN
jgi:hypothetical protein